MVKRRLFQLCLLAVGVSGSLLASNSCAEDRSEGKKEDLFSSSTEPTLEHTVTRATRNPIRVLEYAGQVRVFVRDQFGFRVNTGFLGMNQDSKRT